MNVSWYIKKIIEHSRNGTLGEKVMERTFGQVAYRFINKFKWFFPLRQNQIFIMTFQNDYTCNSKYIVEELLRRNFCYKIIWAVKNVSDVKGNFPEQVILVKRRSFAFYRAVFTSKIWIDNAMNFFNEKVDKKTGQIFINTWHGSMGLKRIGEGNPNNEVWVNKSNRCKKETDYCITNSLFEEDVYRATYWPNNVFWKFGHPRNDILVNTNNSTIIRKKFCKRYGIDENKKTVLYAPTFREGFGTNYYNINFDNLILALERRFGGTWVVLSRMHYHLKKNKTANYTYENSNVVNVTDYTDMQELMLIADVGITDYSSWICDFVLTEKPGFIFAPDLKEYTDTRGFYYPLDTTPFPLSNSNEQLINNIRAFNEAEYKEKCIEFLNDRGCYETGKASALIVDEISKIIEGGK